MALELPRLRLGYTILSLFNRAMYMHLQVFAHGHRRGIAKPAGAVLGAPFISGERIVDTEQNPIWLTLLNDRCHGSRFKHAASSNPDVLIPYLSQQPFWLDSHQGHCWE